MKERLNMELTMECILAFLRVSSLNYTPMFEIVGTNEPVSKELVNLHVYAKERPDAKLCPDIFICYRDQVSDHNVYILQLWLDTVIHTWSSIIKIERANEEYIVKGIELETRCRLLAQDYKGKTQS